MYTAIHRYIKDRFKSIYAELNSKEDQEIFIQDLNREIQSKGIVAGPGPARRLRGDHPRHPEGVVLPQQPPAAHHRLPGQPRPRGLPDEQRPRPVLCRGTGKRLLRHEPRSSRPHPRGDQKVTMFRTLDRYIFREMLPPFFLSMAVLLLVLFLQKLFRLSDLVMSKGASLAVDGARCSSTSCRVFSSSPSPCRCSSRRSRPSPA